MPIGTLSSRCNSRAKKYAVDENVEIESGEHAVAPRAHVFELFGAFRIGPQPFFHALADTRLDILAGGERPVADIPDEFLAEGVRLVHQLQDGRRVGGCARPQPDCPTG